MRNTLSFLLAMAIIVVVSLLFLTLPGCERADPPAEHDASIVQPPSDAGSATPDARTSRPGAGPLDPDLTIDCVISTVYQASISTTTGEEAARSFPGFAFWSEDILPAKTWLCWDEPFDVPNCYFGGSCEVRGGTPIHQQCQEATWNVTMDGRYYVQCGGKYETDYDGDGVFEPPYPGIYTEQYLAIVR